MSEHLRLTLDSLPQIYNYGQYSSDNYGKHTLCVSIGAFSFYFSYDTMVAFRAPGCGLVVHENVWSRTTGKHLNWIDDKRGHRVNTDRFEALWKEYVCQEEEVAFAAARMTGNSPPPRRRAVLRLKPEEENAIRTEDARTQELLPA